MAKKPSSRKPVLDPNQCLGWDRCEICGKMAGLWEFWNKDIGKILEILPKGRRELRCQDCMLKVLS